MQNRGRLRRLCPTAPGVYYWFDTTGQLIYVGKAKSLRHRLLGYFQSQPSDDKMRRIREVGQRLVWEETTHEFLALVREQEVISEYRPSWNVQGQPKRQRYAFLCISNHPAANLYVSFDQTPTARAYFGPLLGSGRLREAAEAMNHWFALRDCSERTPMDFGLQPLLFPLQKDALCLRHEIGTCLGPCTGKVSKADYQQSVQRALNFLHGRDRSLLRQLQAQMGEAATERRFEKAAVVRDRLKLLQWVDRRLEDLRRTRFEFNCVYQLSSPTGRRWWALLVQGTVWHVLREPTNRRAAQRALRHLQQAADACLLTDNAGGKGTGTVGECRWGPAGGPRPSRYADPEADGDRGPLTAQVPRLLMQSLVQRWFRRQPEEKQRLSSYAAALEHCRQQK